MKYRKKQIIIYACQAPFIVIYWFSKLFLFLGKKLDNLHYFIEVGIGDFLIDKIPDEESK